MQSGQYFDAMIIGGAHAGAEAAWAALSRIESLSPTALPALLTLDRLRRNIEKQFPKACPFIRPGFDTLRFQ